MKYVDSEKLIAEIERRIESWTIRGKHSPAGQGRDTCESRVTELSDLLSFTTSLQQECEIVEFSFKGGTYRVNGEEHALKGGKAKVIILEINQEEENV